MADKKPLVNSAGNAVEIAAGDTIPITNGGTGATTKGGAVQNLLTESVSIANCANTTNEVTVISATVAANTWADMEEVVLQVACTHRQFSGVSRNLTTKAKVGANSFTMLSSGAVASSTTIGYSTRTYKFLRVGTEVWFTAANAQAGLGTGTTAGGAAGISADQFGGSNATRYTGVDFTTSLTLAITVQWSAADANVYFNIDGGKAFKL